MLPYHDHYTIEDYNQWQGDWELLGGMPYAMTPSPSVSHQQIAGKIFRQLDEQLDACDQCRALIEVDWEVCSDTIVRPDILVICHEPGERVIITPDLIVEVVSPSSVRRDERLKFELYETEGVLYYLVVYPDKSLVKAYLNKGDGFRKLGDFSGDTCEFKLRECALALDFSKVWR